MTKNNKTKTNLFNKLFIFIVFAMAFSMLCPAFFKNKTSAESEVQTWSNLNFASNNNISNVYTNPTGWTKQISLSPATSGAINLDKYNDSFYLDSNEQLPKKLSETADSHVLMINSKSSTSTLPCAQYYTNSSSLKLDAYSHYKITVYVQVTEGASASVYVTGLDQTMGYTGINSNYAGIWAPYTFYISTGIKTEEIKTELWLGAKGGAVSSGAVFFDNMTALKISNNNLPAFTNTKDTLVSAQSNKSDNVKHYDLNSETKQYINGTNGSFENIDDNNTTDPNYNLNGWTKTVSQMKSGTYAQILKLDKNTASGKGLTYVGSDLTKNNNYGLALYTTNDVKSHFGLKSNEISLNMYETIKVSINVKVADLNGGNAYVKFIESDVLNADGNKVEGITPVTKEIAISSNSTNKLQNNYTTCSFYIKGRSLYNTNFRIELWLGNEESETSGLAVFDNLTIETISSDAFSSVTTDTNTLSVDLNTEDGSFGITNATFNKVTKEKTTLTYPLIPSDWSHKTSDKNRVYFGVINTYDPIYENYRLVSGYANPGNPDGFLATNKDTNNILVMHNIDSAYQSVTSNSFDVSANKYYKLSFDYKLLQSASDELLNIYVIDENDNILYSDNTSTSSSLWQKYNVYISTNSYSNKLKLVVSLGTEENLVKGVVYLDNVTMLEQTSLTKEDYETLSKTENILDFNEGNFNLTETSNSTIKKPLRYTGKLEVGENGNSGLEIAYGGIIDGANTSDEYDIENSPNNTNSLKYMMLIQSHGEATYSMTASDTLKLSSGTYYKFTVWAKTVFGANATNSTKSYGAEFGLTGINQKITTIVSPEWKEYSIYVNCTEQADVNLRFALSSADTDTKGMVYFDNYSFETIDADTFNKAKLNNESDSSYLFVGNTDSPDDKDTSTSSGANLDYIWYVIPSLILAVALVIALVSHLMKKVKIKKWEKKKVNEYDRERTVHRDVIRKEAENLRDKNVKEVQEEIKSLQAKIQELQTAHNEQIAKSRKDRAKGVSKAEEKEFKSYAKHVNALENRVSALEKEISNMNTPEYLLSIQHKIAVDKAKSDRIKKEKSLSKKK